MNVKKKDDRKALEALARREAERVGALQISPIASPEEFQRAGELRREIKTSEKAIEDAKRKIVDPLNEALRNIRLFFRPFEDRCKKALGHLDQEMKKYERSEEQKRREEEARLRALAEKENEKLRKKAERQAAKAEKKGDEAKAAEIRNAVPLVSMPVVAKSEVPKVEGVTRRTAWKARVINPKHQRALLHAAITFYNFHVSKGDAPAPLGVRDGELVMEAQFWQIDEKALGAFARTTKGEVSVPGVEFYDEPIYATEAL